jgi:hypothetical protein
MSLNLNSVISRNETHFLTNPVGDEIIILNMETGDYLGLNSVGASIWEMLNTPHSVSEIIDKLLGEFDVEKETCTIQTLEYLEKIKVIGLLNVAG